MEVIGFILIVGMVLVFFVVTKIGAKTNMSDEEREKALEAFYSQPSVEGKPSGFWDLLREGFNEEEESLFDNNHDEYINSPVFSYLPVNIYYSSDD